MPHKTIFFSRHFQQRKQFRSGEEVKDEMEVINGIENDSSKTKKILLPRSKYFTAAQANSRSRRRKSISELRLIFHAINFDLFRRLPSRARKNIMTTFFRAKI